MKTGARFFAFALAGALACANVPLHSEEARSPLKMKPMKAVSLDVGDKHVVSYFLNDGGACRLTLMIADSLDAAPAQPSRVVAAISSSKSARFDTVQGKTLSFSCENGAQSMSVAELG